MADDGKISSYLFTVEIDGIRDVHAGRLQSGDIDAQPCLLS